MHQSLVQIVSGGYDRHTMLYSSSFGLLDHLVNAADHAAAEASRRFSDMHKCAIVTEVTHYAIAHSLSLRFRREPRPTPRRELLIFHIALENAENPLRRPVPVGIIIVERFHGKRESARCLYFTALTAHGDSTADYPPFSPGETTLDIYNGYRAMPLLKSTRIITEKFTLPARNTTTSDSAVVAARAGLLNIAAATEVFQDLFRGYSFSIRQQHWYASVIRHLVAGRAPPPLSDDDVRDLLPPATGEGKGADSNVTLADDTESSKGTRNSHALIFMSPEQLREAHARLKACYDEKLENIRQQVAAGGSRTRSHNAQVSCLQKRCQLLSENYELLKKSYELLKNESDQTKHLAEINGKSNETEQTVAREESEHLRIQAEDHKETVKLPESGAELTWELVTAATQRAETLEKEVERLRALLAERARLQD